MKYNMSVWTWPYPTRYYLLRPWKWVRQLIINKHNAHNRAKKGYCYLDWCDFDNWFIHIAPEMLREIATKGQAYPGQPPFETPEEWHEWLNRMADQLECCTEEWSDENDKNEFEEQFMENAKEAEKRVTSDDPLVSPDLSKVLTPAEKIIKTKYFDREHERYQTRMKLFKETMLELIEHWDKLWD